VCGRRTVGVVSAWSCTRAPYDSSNPFNLIINIAVGGAWPCAGAPPAQPCTTTTTPRRARSTHGAQLPPLSNRVRRSVVSIDSFVALLAVLPATSCPGDDSTLLPGSSLNYAPYKQMTIYNITFVSE
jgi:hypothetical protein